MTPEEGGPDVTTRQGAEDIAKSTDLSTTSTQLKQPRGIEVSGPRKNTKASKLDIEPITLTEGDLYNIGDIVHDFTREVLQEAMVEKQHVLGALRAQM